jgi:NitT/TauT family transport system substrate-binding protein
VTKLRFLLPLLLVASPSLAAESLQVASPGIGSSAAPTAVAIELGYFRDVGLDVTLFDSGGGNNAVATVLSGDAQLALVGLRNASKPVAKDQPIKIIGVDTQGFQQAVVIRTDLFRKDGLTANAPLAKKGAALKGLRIAVNDIGGSSGDLARYALAAAGLGERDATILNINSAAGRQVALKAGRIDALVDTPPGPEIATDRGYGTVLVDPAKDLPSLGILAASVEIVRTDYLHEHKAALVRYVQAVNRARSLIRTNSALAEKAYYEFLRDQNQASLLSDKVNDEAWKDSLPAFSASLVLTPRQFENSRKFFDIPASVTFDKFVDNSLAEASEATK